jgi:hypothetical protein
MQSSVRSLEASSLRLLDFLLVDGGPQEFVEVDLCIGTC